MRSSGISVRTRGVGAAVVLLTALGAPGGFLTPGTAAAGELPRPALPAWVSPPSPARAPDPALIPSVLPASFQSAPLPPDPSPPKADAPPAGDNTGGSSSAPAGSDGVRLNDWWRNGLRFESEDKAFSLYVGGRVQFDAVSYIATSQMRNNIPGNVPLEDGVSFRRVRLDMGGTVYKNIEFLTQVDFFNGFTAGPSRDRLTNATYPTDLWVTFKDLPLLGNVRVGNHKPWYSFEHLTSSRFLNFLERSLGFDAFAEGQNNGFLPGVSAFDTYADKHGTWAIGLFKYTRGPLGWNVGRNEAEVNGRVTYLPVYEDDGRLLVHVGLGAAHRDTDDGQARYRSRLDARNSPSGFAPLVADTGAFFGSQQQLLIPEFVAVAGPFSFQSEYYAGWVQNAATAPASAAALPVPQGTLFFQSWYAEAHYFLTGEHREYNRDAGVFTRVSPRNPVAWTRCGFTGWGAWQVAARYSYLDLNCKGITGGRVHDLTLGLNWFLNPNMKLQGNYFLADRDAAGTAGDGLVHGFAVRTAIDF